MNYSRLIAAAFLVMCAHAAPVRSFDSVVKPFLRKQCEACHNPQLSSGGLNLTPFQSMPETEALRNRAVWEKVADKLITGQMPPPAAKRPAPSQVTAVVRWIEREYSRIDKAAGPNPGRVTARRLNRSEYVNTIRDLLGVTVHAAKDFPVDESGYGFDNIGDVLSVSPVLTEKYLKAAREVAKSAIVVPQERTPTTVERYTAERLQQVRKMSLVFEHRFPVDGEYTFRATFFQALRAQTKFHGSIRLDGKSVSETPLVFTYEMDRAFEAHNLAVPAGLHKIEAEIRMEPDYKGSMPYVDAVDIRGPVKQNAPTLSGSHKKIMICGHAFGGHDAACARRILTPLVRRAYRRPVTSADVEKVTNFTTLAAQQGESFEHGLRLAIEAMLVSPHFLFHIERDQPGAAPSHRITQHELASRLSYFLWSSMPDETLTKLADAAQLRSPGVLAAQVRRLLADPKSRAFVENFGGQWLQLRNLETARPDPARFPAFDERLRAAMRTETELFLETLVREDRSVLDLLDGRFTFLNGRLAKHYGITGVTGAAFQRVPLDGVQRSGVLTHASVMTVSSYPTRTSPVVRGKWVLENLLNAPPPPPPDNVPPLDENAVGSTGTMRQQLDRHRSNALCASCHTRMDPLGFGLENYDAIGQWRTMDGSFPVDTSGVGPNGKPFSSPAELKRILRSDSATFVRALTEKLMTYGLGRGIERFDRPQVNAIVTQAAPGGYRFSSLILGIVNSMPFQMRKAEHSSVVQVRR